MMMETALNRKIEETLAKLSASVATPTRGWSFLPSVTKAPLVPEALPSLRLKPPRFDGENARDWINKIQTYYNHHYTPLDDRLYLTQYLFDPPASDWMEYWVENNKGKGWDDFLLALKQRFDPDLYDYVGRLATLRQISTIEAYQTSFESLLQKASHIGDSTLSSLFIAGLKSPMKQVVLMRRPSTLQETFAIVQKLDQRKPNRTKIQEAIDDGEGIPKAPSPAAPSTATAARANQPMDEVGKMILEVDEEILDVGEENKLDALPLKEFVVATDSSILDATTDSVLDVATKFFSMDEVVYDESLGSNEVDPSKDEDTTSLFACELAQPTVTFVTCVDVDFQSYKMGEGIVQVETRPIRGFPSDATWVLDLYGDARTIPPRFRERATSCTLSKLQRDETAAIIVAANSEEREGKVPTSAVEHSSKVVNAFSGAAGGGCDTRHLKIQHSLGLPKSVEVYDHAVESLGKDVKPMYLTDAFLEKNIGVVGDGVFHGEFVGEILISSDNVGVSVSACVADVIMLHYYCHKFLEERVSSPIFTTSTFATTRTRWGHETLCYGAIKGVRIFDPGDFESTSTLDETHVFLFHYPP